MGNLASTTRTIPITERRATFHCYFQGDVVGVVRLDCDSGDVGIIRQLAIDGPAQGVGHGRVLLELLVARGIALGFRALEVNSDKQAVGFYQRFRFNLIHGEREYPLLQLSIR